MGKRAKAALAAGLLIATGVLAVVFAGRLNTPGPADDTYEVVRTRRQPAEAPDLLADDKLSDKKTLFDPALADTRPLSAGEHRWQLNTSAAVLELDVADLDPESRSNLRALYPSYAAANKAVAGDVLPSVNLLSAKAKQFDDGLYAALDLHNAWNTEPGLSSMELLVRQVLTELNPTGEAAAFLWAALDVGGRLSPDEQTRRPRGAARYLKLFAEDPTQSRPVGFYEWTPELQAVFRFLRFLQQPLNKHAGVAPLLARALNKNPGCVEQYRRMLAFYARLTNELEGRNLLELGEVAPDQPIAGDSVHFLPYSRSRETDLFRKLYPQGIPPQADLMRDFVLAIRDGRVDLTPREDSGWYEYQQWTLETFLLPERGSEHAKLLLRRKYKQRMLQAFEALVTRYRETHIRQATANAAASNSPYPGPPHGAVKPRLRVEPNPTYFLRVARSYAFLQHFLQQDGVPLDKLHGVREGGWREDTLGDELQNMRLLFCGLHLVACEDIGMVPELQPGEVPSLDQARVLASKWLEGWSTDPDLAVDTRVAVPLHGDSSMRFWCTLGVRCVHLEARYATAPSWRPWPAEGETPAPWKELRFSELEPECYVLLVDEFAEVSTRDGQTLTRTELRDACDTFATKEHIVKALARR
ncbi:MAG: hypothetical protein IT463_01890 [Planctomycetes bacterium]|nr:hypothetical protein [Planctomycetota bacterium]